MALIKLPCSVFVHLDFIRATKSIMECNKSKLLKIFLFYVCHEQVKILTLKINHVVVHAFLNLIRASESTVERKFQQLRTFLLYVYVIITISKSKFCVGNPHVVICPCTPPQLDQGHEGHGGADFSGNVWDMPDTMQKTTSKSVHRNLGIYRCNRQTTRRQ